MAMRKFETLAQDRRPAFTLIELIVVMSIMAVLAAMVVSVWSLNGRNKAMSGASQIQNGLLVAKQRALRDQVPRGIRLVLDSAPPPGITAQASTFQFIEQPDNFTGG